jgi:rod shape-determining protein MreD
MSADFFKRLGWFALFFLAQVIVLGRIHLFHYATPLFYVYFVAMFPRNYPKWSVLLWSFLLGLIIDIFSNTPGLAASVMTILAAIQPYYLELYVPRDSADNLQPSMKTLGPVKYAYYVVPMVLLYCLLFYCLEMFTFFNAFYWLMCVVGSSLLTIVLIFTFEIAKRNR